MTQSNIEWTDRVWNPLLGCTKVSEGCRHCYAMREAWRWQHSSNAKVAAAYAGLARQVNGKPEWTGRVNLIEERLTAPLRVKKPTPRSEAPDRGQPETGSLGNAE